MAKKTLIEIPYTVRTTDLEVGMFISIPKKYWMKHPFLRSRFLVKNEDEIQVMLKSGVNEVICHPTKSKVAPRKKRQGAARTVSDSITPPEVINKRIEDLWNSKKRIQSEVDHRREAFRKTLEMHVSHIRAANELEKMILAKAPAETIQALISEEWDGVQESLSIAESDISISIVNNSSNTLPYHHGTNTAVLSLILAREIGFEGEDLKQIILGSVLHDIGLNFLPRNLRNWKRKLTKVEWNGRKQHLEEGVKILLQTGLFSESVLKITANHHEHYNGMGYYKLKGDAISPLTRIVSICNYYDRQINHPVLTERLTPHQAIQQMYKLFRERFDLEYLVCFIQLMGIYPAGSIVKLSDGNVGSVVGIYQEEIMNPEIILYDPEIDPRDALFYRVKDLGADVEIIEDILPGSLPSSVRSYLNLSENLSYSPF